MSKSKAAIFDWSRVDTSGGPNACWPWAGSLNRWGYGACQFMGRTSNASRAAFISKNGPVEAGLVVCHRCDYPACCNPSHLYQATQAENLADCRNKGRMVYRTGADHHRPCAKLTEETVREARRLYHEGVSQTEIGRRFGMHSSSISRVVRREVWSHVE